MYVVAERVIPAMQSLGYQPINALEVSVLASAGAVVMQLHHQRGVVLSTDA